MRKNFVAEIEDRILSGDLQPMELNPRMIIALEQKAKAFLKKEKKSSRVEIIYA